MLKNKNKVEPYLVHQESEADVLICNEYIMLPSFFKRNIFNFELKKIMHEALYKKICDLYSVYNESVPEHCRFETGDYILNSIPSKISKNLFDGINSNLKIIIQNNYLDCNDMLIINKEYLDCNDELLLSSLSNKDPIKIDRYKHEFIDFFSKNYRLLNHKIYCVTMFNDMSHPYFYRKNHEHVPGMMIIEAVRQAFYGFTYRFNKANRGEVSISISTLNSKFYHYTQSNYPLRIQVEEGLSGDNSTKYNLNLHAKLYQRNMLVGEISYAGIIMELELFNRLRRMGRNEEKYLFSPIKAISNTLILIDDNSTTNIFISKLKSISLKGIAVTLRETCDLKIGQTFKFILDANRDHKIISSCQIVNKTFVSDSVDLYLDYINLSKSTLIKLSDFIKHYTYINEEEYTI